MTNPDDHPTPNNSTAWRDPPPPASPVKIVPGWYGIVEVISAPELSAGWWLRVSKCSPTPSQLRDAARILTELADAMEAGE